MVGSTEPLRHDTSVSPDLRSMKMYPSGCEHDTGPAQLCLSTSHWAVLSESSGRPDGATRRMQATFFAGSPNSYATDSSACAIAVTGVVVAAATIEAAMIMRMFIVRV